MSIPGRNDPCPCGSGKKFKKCCLSKKAGKKFVATKIDTPEKMSSFFQHHVTPAQEALKQKQSEEPIDTKKEKEQSPSSESDLS